MTFRDHFSAQAADYARFRPTYPPALFAWLTSLTARHDLAWDCGTGSGQAALALADSFARVHATDASRAQLAHAGPHPRVQYVAANERTSGLAPGSADLVTAAQAFHWFDAAAFFAECARVLRPGGVVAVWCYALMRIAPDIDDVLTHFHGVVVGPDWPPGRALTDTLYRDVQLPFPEIAPPPFVIEADLDLAALAAYLGTWSAVLRHEQRTGHNPVPDVARRLAGPWGDSAARRRVRWPIGMRAARIPA